MELEIISRGEAGRTPALLFVHGAFHSAVCWDHHYLPWFAAQGWHAHAVSLRGHGRSAGDLINDAPGLEDYVADIRSAMDSIGRPVVLIGHSMGGVLAQMARARHTDVVGAVLLASSPIRPSPGVAWRMLRLSGMDFVRGTLFGDMAASRRAFKSFFFADDLDPALRAAYEAELSLESKLAVRQLFARKPPETPDLKTRPVLVVAGREDWSIPMRDHEWLARTFNAPLEIRPGAHDVTIRAGSRRRPPSMHGCAGHSRLGEATPSFTAGPRCANVRPCPPRSSSTTTRNAARRERRWSSSALRGASRRSWSI